MCCSVVARNLKDTKDFVNLEGYLPSDLYERCKLYYQKRRERFKLTTRAQKKDPEKKIIRKKKNIYHKKIVFHKKKNIYRKKIVFRKK